MLPLSANGPYLPAPFTDNSTAAILATRSQHRYLTGSSSATEATAHHSIEAALMSITPFLVHPASLAHQATAGTKGGLNAHSSVLQDSSALLPPVSRCRATLEATALLEVQRLSSVRQEQKANCATSRVRTDVSPAHLGRAVLREVRPLNRARWVCMLQSLAARRVLHVRRGHIKTRSGKLSASPAQKVCRNVTLPHRRKLKPPTSSKIACRSPLSQTNGHSQGMPGWHVE